MNPELSDGLVLTGFSANGTYAPYFILGANFVVSNTLSALAHYPNGYINSGDASGLQTNFFAPGDFDPKILPFALATGEPITIGEVLTLNGVIGSINNFAGPVLVVTGERDIPFCGGNCFATGDPEIASIPAASQKLFPAASSFEVSIISGAGHGLNLHYTHPTTYGTMQNFLLQHSLAPEKFGHW
ncbi:hypothetical protein LTR70_000047 [Exophiala xenobiotica]|uniref:Uncharacterized protein n=1 Tax=Lithohypha guttulata TaxID=1690604 RepID=A0ABR0KNY3_9EURO|nr:hypothetical protein LTR24_000171 [Lithohypha guttulata]KAK5330725.1 hypothetical protein LTR70_000047 [Exophiala xenobiotica]